MTSVVILKTVDSITRKLKGNKKDQLPVGLLAQLVRALHWYRRGNRVQILYISGFLFTTAKVVSKTATIFFSSKAYISVPFALAIHFKNKKHIYVCPFRLGSML